jgi:signal transduction histidine kinase
MEGSSVRGQQKVSVVQLNEALDLQSFQSEIVRLMTMEFKNAQVYFGVVDGESRIPQLPAWIKSHLERHPALLQKLHQGEMVGISTSEENPMPRPVVAVRSNTVLIPVIRDGALMAVISLVSSTDEPALSAEDIEGARQFGYDAAPIFARLQEIEKLRRSNEELAAKAARSAELEDQLAAIGEDRTALDAILQMRSHQQVHIAHELRTPLAAVRGYARMILDGRSGDINDKQKDYLRVITDNSNKLICLVAWMSYVAELSTPQHLKLSAFDFRDVWAECVKTNQARLAQNSLKLRQQIPDESFVIMGDREKLAYVLNELMAVAAGLATAGGTITVDLTHGREGETHFKLTETGKEIPADVLSKILDRPFNSIAKPTLQNTESSVMSLSGVYDVVGMHGGRVFVNSNPGQGANFLFTLPAVTGSEENSHEQAVNSSRRRR